MDFKIILPLLISYSFCESLKDENSRYFEVKSPYFLQPSSIADASPNDIFDYTNYEAPDMASERSEKVSPYLFKEENGDLRDLFSSSFNNILKSDLNPKQQFLLDQIEAKSRNDNYKLKNLFGNTIPPKKGMRISKEIFYKGTTPKKENFISQAPPKRNVQVGMPRKRGKCCTVGAHGWCFSCERDPSEHSDISYEDLKDFASIPLTIVNLTNSIVKEKTCGHLETQLYETDLQNYQKISPNWLLRVYRIGLCPYILRKKYLGPNTLPSQIVEVKCLCEDSPCSKYGGSFRCTPVEFPIQTLVRDVKSEKFNHDIETVSVACVCAQKPSPYAENGNKYFVGDSNV